MESLSARLAVWGETVLHAPQTLRSWVRTDEIWLAVLASGVGALAGICAVAMNQLTQRAHTLLFALRPGERLSGAIDIERWRVLLIPALGGLMIGSLAWLLARAWPRRPVDPIEANALYGGRMSLRESLVVMIQTMLSNGAGASVGLEAAYAQIGGAVGSKIGLAFRLRRNDMRILVGAGAGAAIAAAFNAPLAGAFYAFELVIGTYSLANLAPVLLAAAASVGIIHLFEGASMSTQIAITGRIAAIDYVPILALGLVCALLGIALMRGVTLTEEVIRRTRLPNCLRTAIGGLIVGGLGVITPRVLSAGHGALEFQLTHQTAISAIALLFLLKALASAISLGSGFRGGLFFASLLLGALVGQFYSDALHIAAHGPALPSDICAVVGMASFAVAVVGGPLTMVFLALESTGSLPITVAVLAAVVVSSLAVRRLFGYSFATWRFHLRGEAIRSAVDVGWVNNLTVAGMMRRDLRTCPITMKIEDFKRAIPLGAHQRVVLIDDQGAYQGIVLVPEVYAAGEEELASLVHYRDQTLLPDMNVKEAIAALAAAESDALAVVENRVSRRVIGLLTEQYALKRYSDELERRKREVTGE